MTTTNEIRIIGFDPSRPPRIRKESYIDLYFALSAKAPTEWCEDFNIMGRRVNPSPKIDAAKGEFIASYVSNMDQIAPHLALLKKAKFAKFNESVDLAVRLGVNPKHALPTSSGISNWSILREKPWAIMLLLCSAKT